LNAGTNNAALTLNFKAAGFDGKEGEPTFPKKGKYP
jgi:hypothetical protein